MKLISELTIKGTTTTYLKTYLYNSVEITESEVCKPHAEARTRYRVALHGKQYGFASMDEAVTFVDRNATIR